MDVQKTDLDGVILFIPKRHADSRGVFVETFRQDIFDAAAGATHFVQDNHSISTAAGTIRGLHFQSPPRAQGKLVRAPKGAILDVAVDIREGSPSFGRFVAVTLSAENWHQLWIPPGFAHGFCTLAAETEVVYKTTDVYSPQHDKGLAFDDPALGIPWPVAEGAAVLSDKDRRHPILADLASGFVYQVNS